MKSIGARIAVWYACAATATLALLFVAGYALLQRHLQHGLDLLNEAEFQQIEARLGPDYSTSILAETANEADLLLADDVAQLDGYRGGHFGGWRALDGPVGRWLADGAQPRPRGQVVVANLGVGAHDVVFGSAVLARAEREGIGVLVTP